MDLQNTRQTGKNGIAIRALGTVLLLAGTALLVGSLVTAHSATPSPNSGRVTTEKTI